MGSIWSDSSPIDPASGRPIKYRSSQLSPHKENQVFFDLDLLIWDAHEEGLEYAYKNTKSQTCQQLTSFEPQSKFAPGFRIGLGGFLPYDTWTLGAIYTYYHTDRHALVKFQFDLRGPVGPGIIAVWTYPSAFADHNIGARFTTAKSKWILHTSFIDLALSRECAIASHFSITALFGIRSSFLHQRYQVDYGGGNLIGGTNPVYILSSGIEMRSNSNHLGLLFGSKAKWCIGKQWDFFGHLSGALLASHFQLSHKEIDLFADSIGALQKQSVRLYSEYWTFRPQGQTSLGFRFHETFIYGHRRFQYRFSAAYEAQIWWKQNQLLRYLDRLNGSSSGANVVPMQGDLIFHGANLEVGFDF